MMSRKEAVILKAIPQQIKWMIANNMVPVWEEWAKTEGWKETIENLQLTWSEQHDYQVLWRTATKAMAEGLRKGKAE
jgi:hypothetical protein